MIESFLEFVKADPIVEIYVEISVSFSHSLKPLVNLDPEEVEHLLENATLILGYSSVTPIHVR